jgi:hypothetical protein
MKKRLRCFKNKKHTPKKKRGSTSDGKSGFGISRKQNTPLREKWFKLSKSSDENEASTFQK